MSDFLKSTLSEIDKAKLRLETVLQNAIDVDKTYTNVSPDIVRTHYDRECGKLMAIQEQNVVIRNDLVTSINKLEECKGLLEQINNLVGNCKRTIDTHKAGTLQDLVRQQVKDPMYADAIEQSDSTLKDVLNRKRGGKTRRLRKHKTQRKKKKKR
jgi:hypothetical protein